MHIFDLCLKLCIQFQTPPSNNIRKVFECKTRVRTTVLLHSRTYKPEQTSYRQALLLTMFILGCVLRSNHRRAAWELMCSWQIIIVLLLLSKEIVLFSCCSAPPRASHSLVQFGGQCTLTPAANYQPGARNHSVYEYVHFGTAAVKLVVDEVAPGHARLLPEAISEV